MIINDQWHNVVCMTWIPNNWLKKFCRFYMAAVFAIISMHGLRIEVYNRNQTYKTKYIISLTFTFIVV